MTEKHRLRNGFSLKGDVKAINKRLDELKNKLGEVTAEIVLEDAKQKKSPLHGCFEWNDTEAARQYRLEQARYVIRAFEIVYEEKGEDEIVVVRFVNLGDRTEKRPYKDVRAVMANKAEREEYIRMVLRKLKALTEQYRHIKELAGVFEEIDRAATTFK